MFTWNISSISIVASRWLIQPLSAATPPNQVLALSTFEYYLLFTVGLGLPGPSVPTRSMP
jgi:hypothetical protein